MKLEINKIARLSNNERYIILNELSYVLFNDGSN